MRNSHADSVRVNYLDFVPNVLSIIDIQNFIMLIFFVSRKKSVQGFESRIFGPRDSQAELSPKNRTNIEVESWIPQILKLRPGHDLLPRFTGQTPWESSWFSVQNNYNYKEDFLKFS